MLDQSTIRHIITRRPISPGQITIYRALYRAGEAGLWDKELKKEIRDGDNDGRLSGILGALGNRIKNSFPDDQGKEGILRLIDCTETNGRWHYRLLPETRRALEEIPELMALFELSVEEIHQRHDDKQWLKIDSENQRSYPMKNMRQIIEAFLKWYENDPHSSNEDYYLQIIAEGHLGQLSKEEFIEFFSDFARDGGKIQSGGHRTEPNLRNSIEEKYDVFRSKIMEPFQPDFNLKTWLEWVDNFSYFGQGLATIFLNRVDKHKYAIVNNKSIEALRRLGFDIKAGKLTRTYTQVEKAEEQLIREFPELKNFYKTDALTHFLIGTEEGEALLNSDYDMDFFNMEELQTLRDWAKADYDKNNEDHQTSYRKLSELYAKIEFWAIETQRRCFPEGSVKIVKRPINQAHKFEEYQWAKIYPSPQDEADRWLAYVLVASSDGFFDVKIDTVGLRADEEQRKMYLDYRGDLNNSRIVKRFSFAEVLNKTWEGFISDTQAALAAIGPHFLRLKGTAASQEKDTSVAEGILPFTKPLNTILFGPPGTGKTYESKSRALEIIDGQIHKTRKEVNRRYSELYDNKQIRFVTFHQSTSYEDFIEGIKPNLDQADNGEEVQYVMEDGIFKQICVQATYEYIRMQHREQAATRTLTFSQLYDELSNRVQQEIDEKGKSRVPLKSGGQLEVIEISNQGNFIVQHQDGQRKYTVSKSRLEKLYNEIGDFSTIPNIYAYFRSIIGGSNASAYWAILNQIYNIPADTFIYTDQPVAYEDKRKAFERIDWQEVNVNLNVPKYVLIIDEINRGNIASILGELITLLEPDKRGGQDESLDVTLPYSKTKFSVPPNLYLIGTMNTADRSVEALDTALRRRFSFEEIAPNPGKLAGIDADGIDLIKLLTVINRRIRKLLDKDYMIGHAYFMNAHQSLTLAELKFIFHNKILPLLQEYFYGNFGKIQLVLGKAFVSEEIEKDFSFAEDAEYDGEDYMERKVYFIEDVINMKDEVFKNALIKIYQKNG